MEIAEAVKGLNLLALEMPRLVQNAARAALNSARTAAAKDFVSKGVGKAIWGGGGKWKRNLAGARLIINRVKFKGPKEGPWDTGISVKGLAALVETGGRTREHLIRKRNGRPLKTPIRHPGSRFQRDPFLERAVPVLNREYPTKLEAGIAKFKQKAGL